MGYTISVPAFLTQALRVIKGKKDSFSKVWIHEEAIPIFVETENSEKREEELKGDDREEAEKEEKKEEEEEEKEEEDTLM